jgi:AraC family transcriptional regulator
VKVLGHGQINFWRGGSLWIGLAQMSADFHAHHAIQLCIGLKGTVRFRTPAQGWIEYSAALVAPHVSHAFDATGSVVANIFCEPESLTGRRLLERFAARDVIEIPRLETEAAVERLRESYAAGEADERLNSAARGVLTTLAALGDAKATTDSRVLAAIARIEQRLDRPIRLGEIAAGVHLSPGRFRHLFAAETGVSFRAYVLWLRLQAALERTRAGASWTEAAYGASFADSAHLSRTFKRMFGVVPASLNRMDPKIGRASLTTAP